MEALRRPAPLVVLVGAVAGVGLVVLVPHFAGIDEGEHFARSYQLTTGRLVPQDPPPGEDQVGACLPEPMSAEITERKVRLNYGTRPTERELEASGEPCSLPGGGPGRFLPFATFSWYSPLGYAPQALGVGALRLVSDEPTVLLLGGRLASLAVYLAIVWLAIRWTPVGRWAMAVVALLPVCLVQAATSLSPDALAIALGLLVVALALRAAAKPTLLAEPRFVAGAAGVGLLLGLTKPTYVLISLLYAVPLVRAGWRRRNLVAVAATVALPVGVSALWHRWRSRDFACDVRAFGGAPEPSEQLRNILTRPHEFLVGVARGTVDNGTTWARRLVVVGEQVAPDHVVSWGLGVVLVVLVVLIWVAVQPSDGETVVLTGRERGLAVGTWVVGTLAVCAGWFTYCTSPGFDLTWVPHVRLFAPFAVLPLVALAGSRVVPRSIARHFMASATGDCPRRALGRLARGARPASRGLRTVGGPAAVASCMCRGPASLCPVGSVAASGLGDRVAAQPVDHGGVVAAGQSGAPVPQAGGGEHATTTAVGPDHVPTSRRRGRRVDSVEHRRAALALGGVHPVPDQPRVGVEDGALLGAHLASVALVVHELGVAGQLDGATGQDVLEGAEPTRLRGVHVAREARVVAPGGLDHRDVGLLARAGDVAVHHPHVGRFADLADDQPVHGGGLARPEDDARGLAAPAGLPEAVRGGQVRSWAHERAGAADAVRARPGERE